MQLQIFRYDTFRRYARMFLEPAIIHKWNMDQQNLFQQIHQGGKVAVGGDMRADSPGKPKTDPKKSNWVTELFLIASHLNIQNVFKRFVTFSGTFSLGHSAKYGSYSLMHLQSNTILDLQLVQVCYTFFGFF